MPSVLVSTEFRSIPDVISGLGCIESRLLEANDCRSIFASTYRIITNIVAHKIELGEFEQSEWLTRYVIAFANLYRVALEQYQCSSTTVPESWKIAFDHAQAKRARVVQYLLLGINAHINYDLPLAAFRTGAPLTSATYERDHNRLNDALRDATPIVRRTVLRLYAPHLRLGGLLSGRYLDRVMQQAFVNSRSFAWQVALSLYKCDSEVQRSLLLKGLDRRAVRIGHTLLRSKASSAQLMRFLSGESVSGVSSI